MELHRTQFFEEALAKKLQPTIAEIKADITRAVEYGKDHIHFVDENLSILEFSYIKKYFGVFGELDSNNFKKSFTLYLKVP